MMGRLAVDAAGVDNESGVGLNQIGIEAVMVGREDADDGLFVVVTGQQVH